jgi:flagellar basal-body rod protein FlgG
MIGMRAEQRALETLAGNISNINTPAFKRVDIRFAELVGAGQAGSQASAAGSVVGVSPWLIAALDTQGQVEATGNPLDLAVDGSGFIELLGPGGKTLLWRGGTLRVMEDGTLATAAGFALKAGITVSDETTALRIDRDGKVYATEAGRDGEALLGELGLARVIDPAAIERLDGGIFAVIDERGLRSALPGEDGLGTLVQGSLERSNVDLNAEMVALLIAQRAYAANAQVARAADEFYGVANGLRR